MKDYEGTVIICVVGGMLTLLMAMVYGASGENIFKTLSTIFGMSTITLCIGVIGTSFLQETEDD